MRIYYSSEAGLCLLYGQLFLLTIFCLPENNEDWGQSESEGKAGREDPTWNYRGDTTESLKWKKCVPETNLNCTVLVRGADVTPRPAHRHLLGRLSRRKPPPGVSPPAPPVDPRILPSLCCDLCPLLPAGPFTALHCSPTGSLSFPSWLSGLLPARLETQASQDLPPASELPLPRPPPLELG